MNNLHILLGVAVLLPLSAFFINLFLGHMLRRNGQSKIAANISLAAIAGAALLSFVSLFVWLTADNDGKSNREQLGILKSANAEHLDHLEAHASGGHEEHGAHDTHEEDGADRSEHEDSEESPGEHDQQEASVTKLNSEVFTALVEEEHAPENAETHSERHDDHVHEAGHDHAHDSETHAAAGHSHGPSFKASHGEYYTLGTFGDLTLSIGYYIDSLTIAMFCMVTFIATLIHWYASKYMDDELPESKRDHHVDPEHHRFLGNFYHKWLTGASDDADDDHHDDHAHTGHGDEDVSEEDYQFVDHEVIMPDGSHCHRQGRYPRFFQALSLFCFSMLGLVLAGNIAMTFVFWELVGICSFFLIGFYVERKSASTAANKAFIANRVGDFGMIIGLMIFWTGFGTFNYDELFSQMGEAGTHTEVVASYGHTHPGVETSIPSGFATEFYADEIHTYAEENGISDDEALNQINAARAEEDKSPLGYWLMIVGGLGIFCGCVGKSAQFPLHIWLPDAMEGPTPVSALVHSATMVAAGVFLVGRFFPMLVPEALFVIAIIGTITLFIGATIAIVATDIKKVLAYSTISQLGYMIMALGVGGWVAGLMHLFTHAFFKSLLFMGSGSVIHAVHTNEMTEMGGLRKKIPITAWTMFIACLAIAGAGIPFVIGTSGYYSKDAILEQAFSWGDHNGWAFGGPFFWIALGSAAITAFYMFRMWFMTFVGKPRDEERFSHAHEYPRMVHPLLILSIMAIGVAWTNPLSPGTELGYMLEAARPEAVAGQTLAGLGSDIQVPDEHLSHMSRVKFPVTLLATLSGIIGIALAFLMYATPPSKYLKASEVKEQFSGIHSFLRNKWWFDELYDFLFVKPSKVIGAFVSAIDKNIFDTILHFSARATKRVANVWTKVADGFVIDGFVDWLGRSVYRVGTSLRRIQTGNLRQYVLFIVIGAVAIFVFVSFMWDPAAANTK